MFMIMHPNYKRANYLLFHFKQNNHSGQHIIFYIFILDF